MKKIFITILLVGSMIASSCSDYLDILPKDQQSTDMYWKSQDDVEAILAEGYYTMRSLTNTFFDWGELRGASIATNDVSSQKIQNFQILPSNAKVAWDKFYHIIGMANSVLKYAPGVVDEDDSYKVEQMKSHQTEAYFMRAFSYFYLVRNFREVPLITEPYVDDEMSISVAKSSETDIIALIKNDIKTALESNAAKETFPATSNWKNPTKGRATKWALYALMADVCLWNEDYDECITYADFLINSTANMRPVFIANSEQWYTLFYPGDSNESIFEIQFDGTLSGQSSGSPSKLFSTSLSAPIFYFSDRMTETLLEEYQNNPRSVRSFYGTYYFLITATDNTQAAIWKYTGMEGNTARGSNNEDANFIIYRMAEVILMKAEALICKGGKENWEAAIDLINQIRQRANVSTIDPSLEESNEESLLYDYLLPERNMELAAEGKRWYDLLRFARKHNFQYKQRFIDLILENNTTGNQKWISSALQSEDAWYLPIPEDELKNNKLLVQNPYYGVTN